MKNYKSIFALVICLCSVFVFSIFKQVPKGQLWKGYSVLYVPVTASDDAVVSVLEQFKIKDYICLSNQFLPLDISVNSPEYSMLVMNSSNKDFSYLYDRNSYFFDKSQNYRVYYILSDYSSLFANVVKELSNWNISACIDSKVQYPVILPLVILVLCVILYFFSKNRFLFLATAFFVVFFIFTNPFYQIAIAASLLILLLFVLSNIWNRKGFVSLILHKFYSVPILVIFVVTAFFASITVGLCSLLLLASLLGVYIIFSDIHKFVASKMIFVPVAILPAKKINLFSKKSFVVLTSILACSIIILVSLFINSSSISSSGDGSVMLPCAKSDLVKDSKLPILDDYYKWVWNVQTYPYKSLNSKDSEDVVVFPKYVEIDNKIVLQEQILSYDSNFKQNIYNNIDYLSSNSVEKLIKSQSENFVPGYSSSGTMQIDFISIIMCIICFMLLLFVYFSIIIREGVKK